jgi:hypothetical protein
MISMKDLGDSPLEWLELQSELSTWTPLQWQVHGEQAEHEERLRKGAVMPRSNQSTRGESDMSERERLRKAVKSRLFRDAYYRMQTQERFDAFPNSPVGKPLSWLRYQQDFISLMQVNSKLEESKKSRLNR